ncbi:hypothetical protein [Pseudomonas sp. MWU16-30322]|uniref:hypothetical protein n=1 Tax=Pseudomonas sp. MWU16-30322 TaxID=2878092 RepID=UPI001CFB684A|nr:hypothetical protein [Pseudomonas sp. MWU16-30322]
MNIVLVPQRRDDTLVIIKSGETLILNGEVFDFSLMGNGDTLPQAAIHSDWFASDITRIDGELEITLILPLPINYSPEQAFPAPLENVPDGRVAFPQPLPVPAIVDATTDRQEVADE